jgi:MYXO-CTERM domain-containing protein
MALAVLGWPPWPESGRRVARWALAGGAAAAVINLPWVLPGLLHASVPEDPSLALRLFRARSDSPVGLMGSLASLGGVWRTDLAPPGRGTWAWVPAFLILAGVAVSGWLILRRRWPIGAVAGLVGVGLVGLVVAAAPGLPGLDAAARWAARTIPGGGVLRDSQKFVIPLALGWAVGFGTGVDAILARMPRGDRLAVAAAVALPVLPVALAPSLAWGAGGRLAPAAYPPSWSAVKEVVDRDPAPGAMVVLPWHAYLPFAWDGGRTVRQPALAYFSRPVVASSSLEVGGFALPDEDPWSALVRPEAVAPRPLGPSLSRLGLRYVLLFKEADWRGSTRRVAGLDLILDTDDLALYRAPPPVSLPTFDTPPAVPVVAGDLAALGLVLVAAVGWRRRRRSPRSTQEDGPTRGPPDMLRPLAEASAEET